MRVLHLLKTSTGAMWAFRQMRELVKRGVEVYVAMPRGGTLVPLYEQAGLKIYYMDFSIKHLPHSNRELRRIVQEINPDIIHSHFVVTTLIMRISLRKDRRPRIFQVPGPLHLESWFFRNLELCLRQKNDYWVGSCLWTNERYRKSGIDADRIFLSYYGSDIKPNDDYIKGKLRGDLGLGDNDILVGIVAYMYAPKRYLGQKRGLKGHEDLIDAIAILKDEYPNLYCVCIGGPWVGAIKYADSLRKYAIKKASGRVFFTGHVPNVRVLYNDLFCAIHPSHSENLGGAGESLSFGVPTIATNVGGFPDIVVNEETGLLVPPKDPEAIADAIRSLIQGKYDIDSMVEKGREKTMRMLDISNTSESIYHIYRTILYV